MEKLVELLSKKRESELKIKTELMKFKLQHEMRMYEAKEKDRISKPERYTPEQEYLKNRFMEENPLAQMMVPEEGQDMTGVTFPASEVQRSKEGTLSTQPINQDRQASLLLAKVDQMLSEGKRPHPMVMKIAKKMSDYLELKGTTQGKLESSKEYVNILQKRLDSLTNNAPNDEKEMESWKQEKDYLNTRIRRLLGAEGSAITEENEGETEKPETEDYSSLWS